VTAATGRSAVWRAVLATVGCACLLAGLAAPAGAAPSIRSKQWHLDFLRAEAANRISDGRGVVVGLVDTGVDARHPDLRRSRILPGYDAIEFKNDGRVDRHGHGTTMAGLIAATGGPGAARGLAPGAVILPGRSIEDDGTGGNDAIAVDWLVRHGAKVLNLSFAGEGERRTLAQSITGALAADVVIVAGAGNAGDGFSDVGYPASAPGVIAVSAVGRDGRLSKVSLTGPEVVLAAPGEDVMSTDVGARYARSTGTSSATALVSATAALVRARFPKLDAANVIYRLIATARDVGPKGRDPQYGYGIVDPVAALTAKVPLVTENPLNVLADVLAQRPSSAPSSSPSPSASASAPVASPVPTGAGSGAVSGDGDDDGSLSLPMLLALGAALMLAGAGLATVLAVRSSRRPARQPPPPTPWPAAPPPPWPPADPDPPRAAGGRGDG